MRNHKTSSIEQRIEIAKSRLRRLWQIYSTKQYISYDNAGGMKLLLQTKHLLINNEINNIRNLKQQLCNSIS